MALNGKVDVSSWARSVSGSADVSDEEDDAGKVEREDWREIIGERLATSSTKKRTTFLHQLVKVAAAADSSGRQLITKHLTLTVPRYIDAPSRKAVLVVLRACLDRSFEEETADTFALLVKWLTAEASKARDSLAPASRFTLLCWTCTTFVAAADRTTDLTERAQWGPLVNTLATLWSSLSVSRSATHKAGQALVRRSIRAHPLLIPVLLETLTASNEIRNSSLLGVVIDVALHLKHQDGRKLVQEQKAKVLQFYITNCINARPAPPENIVHAFDSFVAEFIEQSDLKGTIQPALEKQLLRQPEAILPTATLFVKVYTGPTSSLLIKFLPQIASATRSTNAPTREAAINFFAALSSSADETALKKAAEEFAGPLKGGRTSSPEHRAALFAILSYLPPDETFVNIALGSKEASPEAAAALRRHLPAAITKKSELDLRTLLQTGRRSALAAIGDVLWSMEEGEAATFLDALVPALETALKNASSSPMDAFIAIALAKGGCTVRGGPAFANFVSSNPVLQSVLATGAKPSILLSERVFRKLVEVEEERWLVRAVLSVLQADRKTLQADDKLLAIATQPLLHIVIDGRHHATRTEALAELKRLVEASPRFAYDAILPGLRSWLVREEGTKLSTDDNESRSNSLPQRLRVVLGSLLHFRASETSEDRQAFMGRLLIFAHHPLLALRDSSLWIDFVLRAGLKPDDVVNADIDALFAFIAAETSLSPASPSFAQAAHRAATDLVIVSPADAVPKLMQLIRIDLDIVPLAAFSAQDFAIWQHTGELPHVDVLAAAASKSASKAQANGKDRALAQWDAEQREALAKKKGKAAAPVSKADRALVDAQLTKEQQIRRNVDDALARVRRGLTFVKSLLDATTFGIEAVANDLVQLLMSVAGQTAVVHVAQLVFETFLRLSARCVAGTVDLRRPLAVTVLRAYDSAVVPEQFLVEAQAVLTLRILYRLRFLAERKPVDSAFYAFTSPLLSRVIGSNGVGLASDEAEGKLEQLTLVVEFIAAHARAASDPNFPRLQMIADLLAVLLAYPQLTKTASNGLIGLGEAIEDSATRAELDAFLAGSLVEETHVRLACLQALQPLDLTDRETSTELWLLCQEVDERNAKLACTIWEENGLEVTDAFLSQFAPYLSHESSAIRSCAARAIATATKLHPHRVPDVLSLLRDTYEDQAKELVPEFDSYGMLVEASLNREDPWRTRVAIAETLKGLTELLEDNDVETVFGMLIDREALGDRSAEVRAKMLEAGIAVVDMHGKANLQRLMNVFETQLQGGKAPRPVSDLVVESVIILFGRLARHLEPTDPRVIDVTKRLITALRTPSEVVQEAVGECLPPLIKVSKEQAPDLIDALLQDCLHADKYAERRGAAYGLAGAVKGRGIGALKEFGIISRVRDAIEDKKDANARQGAVFAIETLSSTLGRIFEPYVIQVLPLLLQCFGDTVVEVRNATQDAARAIMSKISGHAVKLILPTLLAGLDDRQWRSKKGAIDLIGTMAYLAPRQLSLSLPTILPRLTEVLTDTHAQVRAAANASLKQFGEVITNPEIQAMQSILLDALVDPTRKTTKALDTILATSFAHFIDTSSLALVVPILERGIRERSSELKRKSASIVGTLATITEARDLAPYLPQLVPKVREVLVDPVPEARATAARALGGLVERLGEQAFPDLIISLLQTLQSETSGIDQQGAAQGLAEILAGLGIERLEELLPDIIAQTRSSRSYVREGFISLMVFLPVTFGDRFAPYLGRIIEPVLAGLADESDYVREASLKAGRMIVASHSTKAISLLLPELEKGLFDRSHRIRQSSMQLIGELLFKVTGITGKAEVAEGEDEDDVQTAQVKVPLIEVLGKERRDRVLSAIFITRQDVSGPVRQLAVNVWKTLVPNTPRTVREVLPTLIQIIVRTLAAEGPQQRECAARSLGDLCRKMGESVLADLMPVLQRGTAADERTRQGVQLALTEILAACSDTQIEEHEDAIIEAVRTALVDASSTVRAAAALAFDALQASIGPRAIDKTVPALLETLRRPGPSADAALAALQEIMSVRADKIVPVLIPTLIKPPITAFNARALASLVGVAGNALSRRISNIIDALEHARTTEKDAETLEEVQHAIRAVLSSVSDAEGLSMVQMHLLSLAKSPSASTRTGACKMLATFSVETELDMSDYYVDWVRILVSLFDDRDSDVVQAAWSAMDAFVARIPKDDLESLAPPLRRTIETTGVVGRPLPGFELGLKPIMPILLQGLLAGTAEQREQAAYAMGDVVERISLDALKPHVAQIAGPLIRIIAERFPAQVRAAILSSLTVIVGRVPQARPFYPQIQRTFSKSLADPVSLAVRTRAAAGLGTLMALQPRIDPLITELITGATSSDSGEVRESFIDGLARSVQSGGKNMSPAAQTAVLNLLKNAFESASTVRESAAAAHSRLLASMVQHFGGAMRPLIDSYLTPASGPTSQLASYALRDSIEHSPEALHALGISSALASAVVKTASITDNPSIARPAREAKELLRTTYPWRDDDEIQEKL